MTEKDIEALRKLLQIAEEAEQAVLDEMADAEYELHLDRMAAR